VGEGKQKRGSAQRLDIDTIRVSAIYKDPVQ
jgi:hypothetical protein